MECINDTISLAVDIVITGDFNLDMNKPQCRIKIDSLLLQYNLTQAIKEPTHFTETSNSLLDLFMLTSSLTVLKSGVGEPFLDQQVRFHCPVYCVINFDRKVGSNFKRRYGNTKMGTTLN